MGFMDKVRTQATQLAEKAQEGLQTGKGKLDDMQERKRAAGLLQELGAAVYRQRAGQDTPSTTSDIDRLIGELKQIEDAGVPFLAGADGDGGADGVGGSDPAPPPPPPPGTPDGPGMAAS